MKRIIFLAFCLTVLLAACAAPTPTATFVLPTSTLVVPSATPEPTGTPVPSATPTASPTPPPLEVRFAVVGDFGMDNAAEADVSALIHGWAPDIVITVGDNNYPSGAAGTLDANIGKFFHDFISPYTGAFGAGADVNRFFPTLGNHDWSTDRAQPYLDYFTLPGNERYYDFVWGPVHFFALDSDDREPDGVGMSSVQAAWLQAGLAASTSAWNVVYFHHPPYSSGRHGSTDWMRWPFATWGADAVLSGHDHTYERLLVDGIPYFVNGVGGAARYAFRTPLPESQFRYNAGYGALLVAVNETEMLFEFYNRAGELKDAYRMMKP